MITLPSDASGELDEGALALGSELPSAHPERQGWQLDFPNGVAVDNVQTPPISAELWADARTAWIEFPQGTLPM